MPLTTRTESPGPQTENQRLYMEWITKLGKVLDEVFKHYDNLTCRGQVYLSQQDLDRLGIEISEMDLSTGVPLSSGFAQYFKPTEKSEQELKYTEERDGGICGATGCGALVRAVEKRLRTLHETNSDICQWEPIS